MEQIQRSEFENAIGKLSIAWAIAEYGLDQCIADIFYNKGGSTLIAELPLNARAKIKYFRRAFAELDNLKHFSEHAEKIANTAYKILDERNWCIHGFAADAVAEQFSAIINFRRFVRPSMKHHEDHQVTLDDIKNTHDECTELVVVFGLMLYKPLDIVTKEFTEQILGRFNMEIPIVFRDLQDFA